MLRWISIFGGLLIMMGHHSKSRSRQLRHSPPEASGSLKQTTNQGADMIAFRSTLVLIVVLVLGVSFAIPAEDVSETAYDESESLPCESTPVAWIAVLEDWAQPTTTRPGVVRVHRGVWKRNGQQYKRMPYGLHSIPNARIILDRSLRC
jgi:hypothetical protein